jgi:RND family efflux transporter MFP subunit
MNRIGFLLTAALTLSLNLSAEDIRAVIEPKERTLFTSEVSSSVKAINRKMGESFKEGETLLQLDDVVYLANLMKARAAVSKAEADFEAAKKLWADKVISHSDYRKAEAELATAQAELALALKSFNGCFIKAPYNGKVVNVFVKLFEHVEINQNLIEILDDSILIAKLLVPERYLADISVGDELDLRIIETGATVKAKVVRMGAVLDPVSSLFKVEAKIDNQDNKIRAGMEGIFTLTNKDASK